MTLPEWTPGRAQLGITKFIGFLLLRDRKPEGPRPPGALMIRPGQNTVEATFVGLVYLGLAVAALFQMMAMRTQVTPLRAALLVLPMAALAMVLVHVGLALFALLLVAAHRVGLFRDRPNHEWQSTAFHLVFIVLALLAAWSGPLRWVGIGWLAVVVVEMLLRVVALAMKGRYDEIDSWFRSDV